jgi:hypothetical protein
MIFLEYIYIYIYSPDSSTPAGYIKLKRDGSNICGVLNNPVYPIVHTLKPGSFIFKQRLKHKKHI